MSDSHNNLSRTELEALKDRLDLVEVVQRYGVELRHTGKNWMGLCPFHDDREPSFSVTPQARLWHCFGCRVGGDVFDFVQKRQGIDFAQALEELQAVAGTLPPAPPRGTAAEEESFPGGLTRGDLLGRLQQLWHRRLMESPAAQAYLTKRGLPRQVWETFGLGFSDGSILSLLPKQGDVVEALTRLGVLTGRRQEFFTGCVLVPLEHPEHGVVGFYGRKIEEGAKPAHRYLPGPHRGVFHLEAVKGSPCLWLTESPLDALSVWVAGVRNVSCLFGVSSLPRPLEDLMTRYATREVRFCLDGDEAGRSALERLAEPLRRRGVLCQTVVLPESQDPNQLLQEQGPEGLRTALETLRPLALPAAEPGEDPQLLAATACKSAGRPERSEWTEDGVLLELDDVSYRVTPRPPFGGRLKVTVRARRGSMRFLDTFDLYAQRARAQVVKQLALQLSLELDAADRHLLRLLDVTEEWVTDQAEGRTEELKSQEAPAMSDLQRQDAMAFLSGPGLVQRVLEDMDQLGYVGEEKMKLLGYLIGLSRKQERPLSGIVISQAGAGKSGLTELVESLTPPEEVVLYSRISAQALGYLPRDFLKHKLLILEERVGAEAAEYAIRVLQSRQKLTQAVVIKDPVSGKMRTRHYEVEGPIAYLETTTNPRINHENATRCFELSLDESTEQTRRIHDRQRDQRSQPERRLWRQRRETIRRRHHDAQRLLEPVTVVIPYVQRLSFPSRWLRTRRDNERFLSLIEAAAFLHQHQRESVWLEDEETGEKARFVRANLEDYRLAFELAQEVLRATFHELSRDGQELWEAILAFLGGRHPGNRMHQQPFNRRELRDHCQWQDRRLRQTLEELVEMEYLMVLSGSQGRTFQYTLHPGFEEKGFNPVLELTTPEELERDLAARPLEL